MLRAGIRWRLALKSPPGEGTMASVELPLGSPG